MGKHFSAMEFRCKQGLSLHISHSPNSLFMLREVKALNDLVSLAAEHTFMKVT